MGVRALIVDDERLARNRLRRLLEQQQVDVVAEGENGQEAIHLARQHGVDIIFLDINMPVLNGLQAAQQITSTVLQPPSIVFCTAYDEYALEAFNSSASAYLVKPVNANDLARAIESAGRINRLQASRVMTERLDELPVTVPVAKGATVENVPLSNIGYFRSCEKHVFAHIRGSGEVLVDFTLKELQSMYSELVVRIHRSTLVTIASLQKLERDSSGNAVVYLTEFKNPLPVSRRHLSAVKECF